MWTCPKCSRIFGKAKQPHSCKHVPLEEHFKNKAKAKELFDHLVKLINAKVGKSKIISLPCCIHLFGTYDYLAALPKKDKLEVRISLNRVVDSPRLRVSVPLSAKVYKNCFDISSISEFDKEFMGWVSESYNFNS